MTVPRAPVITGISHFHVPQFFQFHNKVQVLILLFTFFFFILWLAGTEKFTIFQVLFFVDYYKFWSSGWDLGIRLCIKIPLEILFHSPRKLLGCAYTIWVYGQMKIPCTIPCRSPCPRSRVKSYTLSMLICYIRLLCDWSLPLHHYIIYIYILLLIIYSYFDMIGSYGVILSCY